MIESKPFLPHIKMFTPTREGDYSPQEMVLFRKFFGSEGQKLCEQYRTNSSEENDALKQSANDTFYENIKNTFGLKNIDPKRFFREHYRSVGVIIQNLQTDLLKEYGTKPELKDEAVWPDTPARMLRRLSKTEGIDAQLQFETKRGLLLTLISCMQESYLENMGVNLDEEMQNILEVFDQNLYLGDEGEGKFRPVYAIHENDSNEVVDIINNPSDFLIEDEKIHLKRHPKVMRVIDGIGYVVTKSRVKEKKGAILKSIGKAARNGGVIKPITDVQDYFGMKFVVEDPSIDPKVVEKRVIKALKKHPERKIIQVDEDHTVDGDRGQSAKFAVRRLQVYLEGLPPLELMFSSMQNFLNSEFSVGRLDPETGMYDGTAHPIYDPRRLRDVLPHLFPFEIYRIDTDKVLAQRMESIVSQLRDRHVISDTVVLK